MPGARGMVARSEMPGARPEKVARSEVPGARGKLLHEAASPAEPALKTELLTLLNDDTDTDGWAERATNVCWAQLRAPLAGKEALLPGRLTEVRTALDAPTTDRINHEMRSELRARAQVGCALSSIGS